MSQIYRLVCPIISKRNIESIYIYSESQSNSFLFSWLHVDGSAVLPDWATFWGRSAVLPDWATFWGRSDSVARLGYLLRTFSSVVTTSVTSTSAISITNSATTTISTTSTISASTTTFRFFYYFSYYYNLNYFYYFSFYYYFNYFYYFQILLLFQLLLLLSDSSTISASTTISTTSTTIRFFYYFSFYYYFQILQINSFYIYALQLSFSFQHSHAFSAGNACSSYYYSSVLFLHWSLWQPIELYGKKLWNLAHWLRTITTLISPSNMSALNTL